MLRVSGILHGNNVPTKRNRARPQINWHSALSSNDLAKLARVLTKDGAAQHFRNLNWPRPFLSKTRYADAPRNSGRQCTIPIR